MEATFLHLSQSYKGCENEINELMIQIDNMLKDKKAEWNEKHVSLQQEFAIQGETLSDLKFEVRDKDKEISDLRNELVVLDKSNYERRLMLESKVSEMSIVITDLKRQLKYYKNNEVGINDNYRDITISSLQKECDFLKDRVAEYEIVHGTHKTQIELLEEQRSSLLQKNEDLKHKVTKCRKEYQRKLEEAQKQFDHLGSHQQGHDKEVEQLKQELSDKEVEMGNIKGTLEEVLSSNQKNNSSFSQMKHDFDNLTSDRSRLISKNKSLEEENQRMEDTLSTMAQDHKEQSDALQSSYKRMENDVLSLQSQVQLHEKENCFLRKLSLKQLKSQGNPSSTDDQKLFFERLESENAGLKNNILHMESEIAALMQITEESYKRAIDQSKQSDVSQDMVLTHSEVRRVKERYEVHLHNMKREIEELKLENTELKVINDRSGSNNSSMVNSTVSLSGHDDSLHSAVHSRAASGEESVLGMTLHSQALDDTTLHSQADPDTTLHSRGEHDDTTVVNVTLPHTGIISDISLKTPLKNESLNHSDISQKTLERTPSSGSGSSEVMIKEFAVLQANLLKDFESKIDGYLTDFKADIES